MLGVGCFRCFVFGFGVDWLLGFLIVWLFKFGVLGLGGCPDLGSCGLW